MKLYNKISALVLVAVMGMSTVTFTACNDDNDEYGTNQYVGGVHLNVFGPSPVARGGELRFLGSGMDQITSIEIPGCDPITDIKKINDGEIRIIVPQEAQTGYVKLNFANGNITTKTKLTFTEPISIDGFAPAKVKAGDELTITGEYLNLIGEVIFTDKITVAAEDFISQSRKEIKLIVPLEAQTGKIIISDGDEEMPNWIYSDEELEVVLPSVEEPLDLTDAKGGDVIVVKIKDSDLVVNVLLPNGQPLDYAIDADGNIVFTLPEDVTDGTIVAVAASGVEVAIANIGVVVPEIQDVTPAVSLRGGDIVTIKGLNMDQVKDFVFANVADAVSPKEVSPTHVKVAFPAAAQSGIVTINLKSGKSLEIYLETAKPEVLAFNPNPVSAAGEFTMTGKNLDLITKVTFADNITIEANTSVADKLTMIAPATAVTGKLVLTMANGETVETSELGIDAPQCAFITELVSTELKGGELLIAKINNGDKLVEVKVNGNTVQYIVTGDNLYVALPQTASKGSVVTLISSNGEISYTYDVIPATHIENVVWQGAWENPSWLGLSDLAYGGYDWSKVPAGAKLTLYMTPTVAEGAWWCVSLRHGDGWGNLPGNVGSQIDNPADGIAQIVLTREILDDLTANMGLIVTGQNYILTKITISWEISLETEVKLAGMPIVLGSWENHEVGPGTAFIDAGIQVGQKMRIYCDVTGDTPMIQTFDGHWNAWTWPEAGNTQQFNTGNTPDFSCIELNVTEDVYYRATTYTDWGMCIVFQGQNLSITKITLE